MNWEIGIDDWLKAAISINIVDHTFNFSYKSAWQFRVWLVFSNHKPFGEGKIFRYFCQTHPNIWQRALSITSYLICRIGLFSSFLMQGIFTEISFYQLTEEEFRQYFWQITRIFIHFPWKFWNNYAIPLTYICIGITKIGFQVPETMLRKNKFWDM